MEEPDDQEQLARAFVNMDAEWLLSRRIESRARVMVINPRDRSDRRTGEGRPQGRRSRL
jgi:hypothetical protein